MAENSSSGARYHVNPKGDVNQCSAQYSCPYGDFESDHFDTPEEAREAYETAQMNKSFSTLRKNIDLVLDENIDPPAYVDTPFYGGYDQYNDPHCFVCSRHTDHWGEHDDLVEAGLAEYEEDGSVRKTKEWTEEKANKVREESDAKWRHKQELDKLVPAEKINLGMGRDQIAHKVGDLTVSSMSAPGIDAKGKPESRMETMVFNEDGDELFSLGAKDKGLQYYNHDQAVQWAQEYTLREREMADHLGSQVQTDESMNEMSEYYENRPEISIEESSESTSVYNIKANGELKFSTGNRYIGEAAVSASKVGVFNDLMKLDDNPSQTFYSYGTFINSTDGRLETEREEMNNQLTNISSRIKSGGGSPMLEKRSSDLRKTLEINRLAAESKRTLREIEDAKRGLPDDQPPF